MKIKKFLMKKEKQLSNLLPSHLHFLQMLIHLDTPQGLLYLVNQLNKNPMAKNNLAHRIMMSRLMIISKQMKLINKNYTNFKILSNMMII